MDEWININEGKYLAAQVLLVAADGSAVEMIDTVINIYKDRVGTRRLQGQGFINSLHVIELLETHDDLDVLLDLGEDFKYRLVAPTLSGGKIFAPEVKSSMVFIPSQPWIPLSEADYQSTLNTLTRVTD
ncbi:MAG: hypothetical protein WBG37_02575 [Desulfobacterales bacterium]|jgi:hypothetical protein